MKVKVNVFFEKFDSLNEANYSHEGRVIKNIGIQNKTQESVAKAIEKPSNPVLQLLNNMKNFTLGNSFNFEKVYNRILEKFNTPKELKTSEEFSSCLEALMQGLPPDAPTQLRIGSLQSTNHFHELKERLATRTCTRLAMMKAELSTQVA